MNGVLGIGGLLILAVLFYIFKPLFLGIWQGIVALFTGQAKK